MADGARCGLVLLAAGASRRMGRAKQLLPVDGQPLVRRAAAAALAAPVSPVMVVLGCEADAVARALAGLDVRTVVNERWSGGLGTSIRTGLAALLAADPALPGVIIALADQPGVTSGHLAALVTAQQETRCTIIASESRGVPQPPALFSPAWYSRLLALTGDTGARDLLREQSANVATIPLAAAADIDTPEDYDRYTRRRAT